MRTRIRAESQHLTGRRRQVARRPPDEDEFNQLAKDYLHNKDLMDKRKRADAFGDIGGFFDRSTRHIHVRSRTHFGHAVHESMHKVAHPAFHGFYGTFINEGVTQYFADRLLVEHGLGAVTDHKYWDELDCAKKLVALTDWQTVAKAYFQNDTTLRDAMLKKLNMDAGTFQREMNAGKVCARVYQPDDPPDARRLRGHGG